MQFIFAEYVCCGSSLKVIGIIESWRYVFSGSGKEQIIWNYDNFCENKSIVLSHSLNYKIFKNIYYKLI